MLFVFQTCRACLQRVRSATSVVALMLAGCLAAPAQAIELADWPLFSTAVVPGNLALALSVEFPTASSMAYIAKDTSVSDYKPASTYIGYFNPEMCYTYEYNAATPANSYFKPDSPASTHVCSKKWSGNYMNWASMQTLDEFRGIMTGGNRSIDTATGSGTDTILTKTWAAVNQSSKNKAPSRMTNQVSGATPFNWGEATTRTFGLGSRMWIASNDNKKNNAAANDADIHSLKAATPYQTGEADKTKIYELYINVAVCVSAVLKEANCVAYPNSGTPVYKPEGLMQQYAMKLRFAAFGYLNDGTPQRDGGVLRARMNYIGPNKPVPGSDDVANADFAEWSAVTGIMSANPAPKDATDTNNTFGISVGNSGAMNYLNKFGYYAHLYKGSDPVSELYYTALRYFKGLGNVPTYTAGTNAAFADGFPVITKWRKVDDAATGADPILYTCQKNFILGIGDVNTHDDLNLPGSTRTSKNEPGMPSEVSADTSVNVTTATNMVGQLEGAVESLSGGSPVKEFYDSYHIAGLAYDAHTSDIRPTLSDSSLTSDRNMSGKQTISTYWLDVVENQAYLRKNQYWLAAKYGGFTVPDDFLPYAPGNGTGTLPESSWYSNTDTSQGKYDETKTLTSASFSTTTGAYDKRPDNYFFGSSPLAMKSGLIAAFNKMLSELEDASSTAYAMISPNVVSGDAAYASTYSPKTWTSSLSGASVDYNADGVAVATSRWDARDKLEALISPASSRKIVTYCDNASIPAGIAFSVAALAACPTTGRLNYASFATITDANSVSATAAADYVGYLRGSRAKEIGAGKVDEAREVSEGRIYRQRAFLLGDIVNSKTTAVGRPSMSYYDTYNPGYSSFKRRYANRRAVVYAGANDGMLHAFDGTLPVVTTNKDKTTTVAECTFCGQELFAYIPSFVYGTSGTNGTAASAGLASFGSPTRTHHYLVDATPLEADIDISNVCAAGTSSQATECSKVSKTPDWRTLLIGGLGKGGKGFYALDVTNPGMVSTLNGIKTVTEGDWTSEDAVAAKVLWEFPKTTDTTTVARMGYSYGAPTFLKTKKYGWVVVFTSGYNNIDGKGYFFFVNPRTGALLETVATPSGSIEVPLNLAQSEAYSPNHSDFTGDAIYAGDLQGNLWRVDVSSDKATYGAPVKMATFSNAAGAPQPVTTRPLIEIDPITSKRYVLVGTGRLLADRDIASAAVQSIYSVYDGTMAFGQFDKTFADRPAITRASLVENTNLLDGIGSSPAKSTGWYHDLPVTSGLAERVNVNPTAYGGIAFFGVNLPNGATCEPSGTGYIIGVNIGTGKSVLLDGNGKYVGKSESMRGGITDLAIQNVNGKLRVIAGDSAGSVATPPAALSTSAGVKRMNWREVPTQ